MRGQKLSIRSSISDSDEEREYQISTKTTNNRFVGRPSEEDSDIEDELAFAVSEEKKRSSKIPKKKEKPEINSLGIPMGEYIYFGPPSTSLFDSSLKDLRSHWETEEIEYKITRNQGKSYRREKTLFSNIFKLFPKNGDSLQVKNIVSSLQEAGLLKKTRQSYSVVYRTLTRNQVFFIKTGKAMFALRKGFRKWSKPEKIERTIEEHEDFASLQQLIVSAVNQLVPETKATTPSNVFDFLKTFGFNGSWKSIYDGMQSAKFRKQGNIYQLIEEHAPQ